jgi:hypothetical protein
LKWTRELEAEYASRKKLPDLPADVTLRPLDFKHLDQDIEIIRQLYNDAWQDNWGFVPLQREDVESLRAELKPVMRPEMGVIVEKKGKPVAVMLVIPNLHELTKGLGPKPSPLGWIKLAWRVYRHKYNSARILLFGISNEIRHSVGGAVIAMWAVDKVISMLLNMKHQNGWVEAGWVLESNKPLRAILIKHGFFTSRTMRLFELQLKDKTDILGT